MATIRNHYDNLKVARDAPSGVIKAAYKILCQTYHPDKLQNNEDAERIIRLINTSYAVLSDPVQRAAHDAWIRSQEAEQKQRDPFSATGYSSQQRNRPLKHTPPAITAPLRINRVFAVIMLGLFISHGLYVYRAYIKQGIASAQLGLGLIYREGLGLGEIVKDCNKAVFWLRKAAAQGQATAQFELGKMYASTQALCVTKSNIQAAYWFKQSAQQGKAESQYELGLLYELDKGAGQHDSSALYWFTQAAEQGYKEAQFHLGNMLFSGEVGAATGYSQGVSWFIKAAEQGHIKAQLSLGSAYSVGAGVRKNPGLAVYWYRKATEQGNEFAATQISQQGQR